MEVRGRRVVVTGASSGIGRQLALDLAKHGAQPVLLARREELLRQLEEEILAMGGLAEVFPCDVSDLDKVRETAGAILATAPVDILINNAGYGFSGPLLKYSPEEIERLTQTNYLGAVYCICAFVPEMKKRRTGHVVNIASVAGLFPPPYGSSYSATKFAMVAMGLSIRPELAPFGVGVTTICPGWVDTPFFDTHPSLRKPGQSRWGRVLTAAQVSQKTLSAIHHNRGLVIMPVSLAFVVRVMWAIPGLLGLALSIYAKMVRKLFPEGGKQGI